jgi:tetratricopeptide (TPR) repeat protein
MTTPLNSPDAAEIRARAQALHDIPTEPNNSRAVRAEAWALLADLLISDYLHGWNGAGGGERQAAERAADEALKLNPGHALAHYAKGLVFRSKGQHDKAIQEFDAAIAADARFAAAFAQKAGALLSEGDAAGALALINQAIGMVVPGHQSLGAFHWIRGRICFFKKDYPEAIKSLKASVGLRKKDWYNRAYLAAAYFLNNDANSAAGELKALDAEVEPYTLAKVSDKEKAHPNNRSDFREMRDRLHKALKDAGMPP